MYFITPSDPKIILFGINETQIYGFGEKNGKLCIYMKAIFDIGEWKKFYLIDINVVKCEGCNGGIHAAGGICSIDQIKTIGVPKEPAIWIAAREKEFTHIFSINIETKKFIRYKMMLQEEEDEANPAPPLNLNLCCKCLNPFIHLYFPATSFISLDIIPRKYQSNVGILCIRANIDESQQCTLKKDGDPLTLIQPPLSTSSNILVNMNKEILSISGKADKRIQKLSLESADFQNDIYFPDDDDIELVCHELAFCPDAGLCLTRRNDKEKSNLILNDIYFSDTVGFLLLANCTVDTNFPSLESIHFFVSWRTIDEEYASKITNKIGFLLSDLYAIPSIMVFQTADGKSIVTIPLRILSLSELAYLSLARISHWPLQRRRSLPIATISIYDQFFQQLWEFCGKIEAQGNPWMTQDFIKAAIGWPQILPLTKAPNLSNYK